MPDELIVDDSGLHARTSRATINQRALVPREKIQRGVCQNQSTHSLRDAQGHDIKQTTPRTTRTGGWAKGRVSGSEPEGWLALDFLSSRAKELVARSSATTANTAAAATSAAAGAARPMPTQLQRATAGDKVVKIST